MLKVLPKQLALLGLLILTACNSSGSPAATFTPVLSPVEATATTNPSLASPSETPFLLGATISPIPPMQTATLSLPTLTLTPYHTPTITPTPSPLEFPIAGMEIHNLSQVDLANQAGAHWIRRNAILWSDVEVQPGERRWEALANIERELESMAALGMPVILMVRSTPEWAQKVPGSLCGPIETGSLDEFADFIFDVVSRYSAPPYNVEYWEFGNEPDVDPSMVPSDYPFGCWGDMTDPLYGGGYYAEMLKAVYPKIKAANPQAKVLVGGLLLDCDPVMPPEIPPGSGKMKDCSPTYFLQGILENGGGDYFDGVSFHSYDYYLNTLGQYGNGNWHSTWNTSGPVVIAKTRYLRSLLASYGLSNKFLMNTESALICGREGNEPECVTGDFDQTKAYYLAESAAVAQTLGLKANIWYSISGWRGSGLINHNILTPAYQAFLFSAQMLDKAAAWGAVQDYPGLIGYEFRRDGNTLWLLWSLDGAPHSITLPKTPSAVYDVFGVAQTASDELSVTISPVYILWEP